MPEGDLLEQRVLVLAPTGRDAILACQLLASMDVASHPCADAPDLFREAEAEKAAASGKVPRSAPYRCCQNGWFERSGWSPQLTWRWWLVGMAAEPMIVT